MLLAYSSGERGGLLLAHGYYYLPPLNLEEVGGWRHHPFSKGDIHDLASLKVHKREKFFVSDFEFFTIL
jgi:hypothetical protein